LIREEAVVNAGHLQRTRGLPLFRGINFSSLEVEADLGGAVFVVGSVVCLLIGLPIARLMFAGAVAGGAVLAAALVWWHRCHPWAGPEHARHVTFGTF
jgi:hypothetical protein